MGKIFGQIANKCVKRCSRSYVIRELQIKTTMSYYYTPVRMAKIWDTDHTKRWGGGKETGTLIIAGEVPTALVTLEDSLAMS